jgi:adenylyltransferase/sulfurtransferase
VLGVVAGVCGVVQAAEAVKYVLGIGELLTNRLLSFNALEMRFRPVRVARNPTCRLCGENATITTLTDE